MCRFVGYHGQFPIFLDALIDRPEHSLIVQSRRAKETPTGLNADGFGIGWFDEFVPQRPAMMKSVSPAWNDRNLCSVTSVVRSRCFIAHVRASTVGSVHIGNSHPFQFQQILCAQNGTIEGFAAIRRHLYPLISRDEDLKAIEGNTDSEHLFALCSSMLGERPAHVDEILVALRKAIEVTRGLQQEHAPGAVIRANVLMTPGDGLLALRYGSSETKAPISLYYAPVMVEAEGKDPVFSISLQEANGVVVASEPLSSDEGLWKEVPANHFLRVGGNGSMHISPFDEAATS